MHIRESRLCNCMVRSIFRRMISSGHQMCSNVVCHREHSVHDRGIPLYQSHCTTDVLPESDALSRLQLPEPSGLPSASLDSVDKASGPATILFLQAVLRVSQSVRKQEKISLLY